MENSQFKHALTELVQRPIQKIEDVEDLLNLCRDYFTKKDLTYQQAHLMLWFVSDWPYIKNVGDTMSALMYFKLFNQTLENTKNVDSRFEFIYEFTKTFSFEVLREQLGAILKEYKLPLDTVRLPYSWRRISKHVTTLLKNKPLAFPNPNSLALEKVYSKREIERIKERKGVISLSISEFDKALLEGRSAHPNDTAVSLVIMTHDGQKIVIPI